MRQVFSIHVTADGSPTVVNEALGAAYHSEHGAIQESKHVFIQQGLQEALSVFPDGELQIFEMGFGTGLNAALTEPAMRKSNRSVCYTAVDMYPLDIATWSALNFEGIESSLFLQLHQSTWGSPQTIRPGFTLHKMHQSLLDCVLPPDSVHCLYFDAFAPDVQPQLWTEAVFQKLHAASVPGAVLTTYCSKGAVRRAMQAAGWAVEKVPGPPGKREMVRAKKTA